MAQRSFQSQSLSSKIIIALSLAAAAAVFGLYNQMAVKEASILVRLLGALSTLAIGYGIYYLNHLRISNPAGFRRAIGTAFISALLASAVVATVRAFPPHEIIIPIFFWQVILVAALGASVVFGRVRQQ